jgi:hypothetical protein
LLVENDIVTTEVTVGIETPEPHGVERVPELTVSVPLALQLYGFVVIALILVGSCG